MLKLVLGLEVFARPEFKQALAIPSLVRLWNVLMLLMVLGAHIIADGGCTCPGDVAKAFGAGADFTMLGGMLAGHDEGKEN